MPTKLRTTLALAASLTALFAAEVASAQTSPEPEGRTKNSGFALQTSLVSVPLLLDDDLIGLPSLEGGLTLGYKFDRIVVSLGFDFSNFSEDDTITDFDPNTGAETRIDRTRDTYSFVVYPELQVAIARSADHRAELFGALSVGLGTWDTRTTLSPDPNPQPTPVEDDLRLRVRWRVAPGVRYWVHPQIGMSLVTGIAGNHMIIEPSTGDNSEAVGLTGLYTQIGFMGVF